MDTENRKKTTTNISKATVNQCFEIGFPRPSYPLPIIENLITLIIMHKIYSLFILRLRSSKLICYLLFSKWYEENKFGGYWDWVTLEFRQVLKKHLTKNDYLLDLGTGPYGILSFYSNSLQRNCDITAVDYCAELIDHAQKIKPSNTIKFLHSDLFEKIENKYNIIVFNAPYIDLQYGKKIGVLNDEMSERRWSGGNKGTETISRFLSDATNYLFDDGICALGINNFYIDDKLVKKLIENSNFKLFSNSKNRLTKANIYLLKKERK